MALSLTENEPTGKPLLTLAESREPEYTPAYTGDQAAKLHLALGENSPGEDVLQRSFTTGGSADYKRTLANQEVIRAQQARNDVLQSIMEVEPGAVTPEMIEVAQGLSVQDMQSPDLDDIIERNYARLYTTTAANMLENDILDEAMEEDPDAALDLLDRTERVVYKHQMISSRAAQLQRELESRSWGQTIWDFTERVIPFVDWYQKMNQAGGESEFVSSTLPGSNLREQYSYLWNLSDPREFRQAFNAAMDDLSSRNLDTAQSWLQGLISYGSHDAFLEDAMGVVDVVTTVPAVSLGRALKGVARMGRASPKNIPEIATSVGRFEDGAVAKVIDELKTDSFFGSSVRRMDELEDTIPSIVAPERMLNGSKSLPREAYLRMKETLRNNSELARRFVLEPNLIDRANPEELVQYRDLLRETYVRENPSIQKSVLDVEILPTADVGNVYQAKVLLGKRDGTLFGSEAQARQYFNRWIGGTQDFTVEQVGSGFRIAIPRTVDESQFLKDAFRIQTDQTTPTSLANTFGGWWRSPTYSVSDQQNLARSTGVTSMERMKGIMEEMSQPISRLPKPQMEELDDLLVRNRQSQMYFKNYGDFEEAFFDRFNKAPTVEQSEAYFTYVQMNDLDLVIRDLDWYKQKAAQGREEITVRMSGGGSDPTPIDFTFEGKVVDSLPDVRTLADSDFNWTLVKDGRANKTRSSRSITQAEREEIARLVRDENYKIIQVADQSLRISEKEFTGFVITKDLSRNRVGVKNVDRRPGGHKVDTYDGYIKQGQISRSEDGTSAFYRGDTTLFGTKTVKEGQDFVRLLNEGREKLLKNEPGAMKWLRDNLPIDAQDFVAKVKAGAIDLSTPFAYTPKGARTIDSGVYHDIPGLRDNGKNIHNLDSQIMGRYAGARDTSDISVVRSEGNQLFEIRGAEYLDPISTLRMSTQNVVSQRAMNDYTVMTTRNFIREFGDILEGTAAEQLAQGNSLLFNPRFKSAVEKTSPERMAAAQNVSRAYKNLMNHGTQLDRKIQHYKDRLIGSIYPKVGPRGQQWLDERQMFGAKDPGVYLRSFAFHSKLGLFNINQLFVQANALVNVAAVGGLNGLRGGMAYPLFRAANLTNQPEIINRIARIAQTTGLMKADEFKESLALYKRSGFHSVGRDTAFLDDISGPEIRRGRVGQVLDYGTVPFKEGERSVRLAAWNTAYLEQKAKAGGRALTRRDEAEILSRAKLLGVDMSRESNATWQKGYAAVFSQFFSFQARLTEQFLGKRLTGMEKARLFTGYSAMYGIPTAVGAGVGIVPVREVVLDTMYGMGIDPTQEVWRPLIDGFANTLMSTLTGKDLNVSDRYGAGGIPTLYDLFRGDESIFEVFGGASGSIALQTISDSIPFLKGVGSELFDFEGGLYNLTKDDIVLPFRNISSVNSAYQMYQVYNLGIWASKNEVNLMEMDLPDAVIAAVTGLQPSELGDSFRRGRAMRGWKEEKDSAMKEIVRNYRRIIRMEPGPEREKAIRMNKAEMELHGLSPQERWRVMRDATSQDIMSDTTFERWERQVEDRRRQEAR